MQNNIVNFHTGDTDSTILVQLWVHYNNDLEKVEQVTSAVAREVRKASAIATRTAIRVYTFLILNSFGVDFAVTLSAED